MTYPRPGLMLYLSPGSPGLEMEHDMTRNKQITDEYNELTALLERLVGRLTDNATTLEQVRDDSGTIEDIQTVSNKLDDLRAQSRAALREAA